MTNIKIHQINLIAYICSLSQRRKDRKFSNIRATKKNNSSPKSKPNQTIIKCNAKQKEASVINSSLTEPKITTNDNPDTSANDQKLNANLSYEDEGNNKITEENEEAPRVNSDIKDFMSSLSADKQSLNNSIGTDSMYETRIKAVKDK